ncbi:MAG TPA: hypothetical protein VFO86_05440 [Terriglobia bacterium]|nr:hypothetical protein [Terriglobia bacterium]
MITEDVVDVHTHTLKEWQGLFISFSQSGISGDRIVNSSLPIVIAPIQIVNFLHPEFISLH